MSAIREAIERMGMMFIAPKCLTPIELRMDEFTDICRAILRAHAQQRLKEMGEKVGEIEVDRCPFCGDRSVWMEDGKWSIGFTSQPNFTPCCGMPLDCEGK